MVSESEYGFVAQRGIYDGGERAQLLITGFVPGREPGLFERFEESVFNTVYHLDDVETLLLSTGWRSAYFARLSQLDKPLDSPEHESRVFIVATR